MSSKLLCLRGMLDGGWVTYSFRTARERIRIYNPMHIEPTATSVTRSGAIVLTKGAKEFAGDADVFILVPPFFSSVSSLPRLFHLNTE